MSHAPSLRSAPAVGVLIAGGLLLAPANTSAAAQHGTGPLAGQWASIDTDFSHQELDITGSGNRVYSMVYVDDSATVCATKPARLSGPGYADGDSVFMVAALICLPGGNQLKERLTIEFRHDAVSDTLTDSFGVVWERVN